MNKCVFDPRIALIGCGSISHTHLAALNYLGIGRIVGLCDIRPERAEYDHESAPDAELFTDYREMIEKTCPDIVHVCTPHYLHKEMAIFAMEHGADVYLEKPCAMNRAEAEEIIACTERTGKHACVSFQNRLINTTVKAKEILQSGTLGKLIGGRGIVNWKRGGAYYTESGWRGKWATEGGGVLMNQSIHTLDMMYYFLGEPASVEGHTALNKNYDVTEVEDTAEAYISFKNGTSGIFYATNCNVADSAIELELFCENGRLLFMNDSLYLMQDSVMTEVCSNEHPKVGKVYWGNGHINMIGNFYRFLSGERDSYYCDIRDAVPVLDIIAGIYRHSEVKPEWA